jgi:hypothetical protein
MSFSASASFFFSSLYVGWFSPILSPDDYPWAYIRQEFRDGKDCKTGVTAADLPCLSDEDTFFITLFLLGGVITTWRRKGGNTFECVSSLHTV